MEPMMTRRTTLRLSGTALFWISGALMLSASSCVVPAPVPGQPLTAEQKAQIDLEAQQDQHERRRQERPCGPNDCKNR
jgi:hypothetical protein